VEIGALYAESPADIETADAGSLYRDGPSARVGMLRTRSPVELAAGREVPVILRATFAGEEVTPKPRTFVTHLLGYRLRDVEGSLLFSLVGTDVAADEAAAVRTFGLVGGDGGKRTARQRFGDDDELVRFVAEHVRAPIPASPPQREANLRVYAVLALGVLGGEVASAALSELAARVDLARFDEPLQVIRVARVLGSDIENALAYAIPVDARRMSDVVAHAQQDLAGWPEVAAPIAAEAPATEPAAPESEPEEPGVITLIAAGLVTGAALAVLVKSLRAKLAKKVTP
jgi:hypothetical protein